MQRVKRTTAVAVLPADPAGGTPGYFPVPNPGGGVPAAVPGYEWYNNVQEELMAVIEGQSIAPSGSDRTQLRQAIAKMIQSSQRAVVIDGVTFNAGVANGNAVYWDSANTRFDKALANGSATQNMVGFADVTNSKLYAFGDAVLFAGLTPGSRYYLDGTTAGAITSTAPTNAIFVGVAKSATEIFVDIDAQPASSGAGIQGAFKNLAASASGTGANISVSADEIIVESAANAYQTLRAVALTIAGTANGANGLDTGALAINTWYSVWVIWNGTTTAGLLSLSATAPTMPGGYTHKARVSWMRTDASGNKYPLGFKQSGRRVQYVVAAGSNVTGAPIIISGVQGSPATPTYVAGAVGAFVPSTAGSIKLLFSGVNDSALCIIAPNNSYGPQGSATNPPWFAINGAQNTYGGNYSQTMEMLLESANIYFASTGATNKVHCLGWDDNL